MHGETVKRKFKILIVCYFSVTHILVFVYREESGIWRTSANQHSYNLKFFRWRHYINFKELYYVQTLPRLSSSYVPGRILPKPELSIYRINYIYTYKEINFNSKLQHTGTSSKTAWPPRRLCCRPAVFSRHPPSSCFYSHKKTFGPRFKYIYIYTHRISGPIRRAVIFSSEILEKIMINVF